MNSSAFFFHSVATMFFYFCDGSVSSYSPAMNLEKGILFTAFLGRLSVWSTLETIALQTASGVYKEESAAGTVFTLARKPASHDFCISLQRRFLSLGSYSKTRMLLKRTV